MKKNFYSFFVALICCTIFMSCSNEDNDTLDFKLNCVSEEEASVIKKIQEEGKLHFFGTDEFVAKVNSVKSQKSYGTRQDSIVALQIIDFSMTYLEKNGVCIDTIQSDEGRAIMSITAICMATIELKECLDEKYKRTRGSLREGLIHCLVDVFLPSSFDVAMSLFEKEFRLDMTKGEIRELIIRIATKMKIKDTKVIATWLSKYVAGVGYVLTIYDVADCLIEYFNLGNNSNKHSNGNQEDIQMGDSIAYYSAGNIDVVSGSSIFV